MKKSLSVLSMLAMLLAVACTTPLDEEDLRCQINEDCENGFACNASGACELLSGPLTITTEALAPGSANTSYAETTMTASGGLGSKTWTLDEGPAWLFLSETGEFSSAPESTAVGEYPVTVSVRDESNGGEGAGVQASYSLSIVGCTGEQSCWANEGEACVLGMRPCVDGVLGECQTAMPLEYSTLFDTCGPGCAGCDNLIADRCEAGECACGEGGAVCAGGDEQCCTRGELIACADLTSIEYCGDCATDCTALVEHVVEVLCTEGACNYTACEDGWHDCDGDRTNGCERPQDDENCAGCDDDCSLYPRVVSGTCDTDSDRCGEFQCESGYRDCDWDADDIDPGCETDITAPENCGSCPGSGGRTCSEETNTACLQDDNGYYCGCDPGLNSNDADNPDGNPACAADQICCAGETGRGLCVPHDGDNCHQCGAACAPWVGGETCRPTEADSGNWDCFCRDLAGVGTDAGCQSWVFSNEECGEDPDTCFCWDGNACQPPEACCNAGGPTDACFNLESDTDNCGMCGAVCTGNVDNPAACEQGACLCPTGVCPSTAGTLTCTFDQVCVCAGYQNNPCPVGMYCRAAGCCTENNDDNCCGGGNVWCADGTCAEPGSCP